MINDERRPTKNAAATQLNVVKDTPDCGHCGGWITSRCVICRGEPAGDISLDQIARGVAQVDRAAAA